MKIDYIEIDIGTSFLETVSSSISMLVDVVISVTINVY